MTTFELIYAIGDKHLSFPSFEEARAAFMRDFPKGVLGAEARMRGEYVLYSGNDAYSIDRPTAYIVKVDGAIDLFMWRTRNDDFAGFHGGPANGLVPVFCEDCQYYDEQCAGCKAFSIEYVRGFRRAIEVMRARNKSTTGCDHFGKKACCCIGQTCADEDRCLAAFGKKEVA